MTRPAGDMHRSAMPDLVPYQDLLGGSRVWGDAGGGYVETTGAKGAHHLAAPNFALTSIVDSSHQIRALSFPVAQWQRVLGEASDSRFWFECLRLYNGFFHSLTIRSALRNSWALCDEQGAPSRLLARAAGCEVMAELWRLSGAPFALAKGGLAAWTERRCLEQMRARLSDDISLEVGYSSDQILARVFLKHMRLSPSDYRRAVRDAVRHRSRFARVRLWRDGNDRP